MLKCLDIVTKPQDFNKIYHKTVCLCVCLQLYGAFTVVKYI